MTLKAKWLFPLLLPLSMAASAADEPAAATRVNPQVLEKLVQMGTYLRSLPGFQVDAQTSRDVVLESGLKIQVQGSSKLKVSGKNKLSIALDSDTQTRNYFYNGKELTQYSPKLHYYTTVPAADSIKGMLEQVEAHYGLELPMVDLFQFGADEAQMNEITVAAYVGPSTINGKLCDHLAFSQPGTDWQLWITRSDKPLPCKLVIANTEEANQPEYAATYTWNLKPKLAANEFSFKPAKGDVAIPFKKVSE
jgi:hypothetical protein